MKEKIKNEILQLLNNSSSVQTGSILINGSWGSGKSYFWKNELEPEIKKSNLCVYVSLAGINSVDGIYEQIVATFFLKKFKKIGDIKLIDLYTTLINLIKNSLKRAWRNLKDLEISFEAKDIPRQIATILDLSDNLPKNAVICFDDTERSNIDFQLLLAACIHLQEQHKSKIFIICNEARLKENKNSFIENREKLVWKSFEFEPDIESIYEIFVKEISNNENIEKFNNLKQEIIEVFNKGEHNLRVLYRSLIEIDYLLTMSDRNISSSQIRFFSSLYLWMNLGNELIEGPAYESRSYFLNTKDDKDELTTRLESHSRKFFYTFFNDYQDVGYLDSIYNYVALGILDVEHLKQEVSPLYHSSITLLRRLKNENFFTKNDSLNQADMNDILKIIDEIDIDINTMMQLLGKLLDISLHSLIDLPKDLDRKVTNIFIRIAANEIELKQNEIKISNTENYEKIQNWILEYNQHLDSHRIKTIQTEIKNFFEPKAERLNLTNISYADSLIQIKALTEDKLLQLVNSKAYINSENHHLFYLNLSALIKHLLNHEQETPYVLKLRRSVEAWEPHDESAKKRKKYLIDEIVVRE